MITTLSTPRPRSIEDEPLRLAFVSDRRYFREGLTDSLRRAGQFVLVVDNVPALSSDVACDFDPDVILIDVQAMEGTASDMPDAARAIVPGVPIVAIGELAQPPESGPRELERTDGCLSAMMDPDQLVEHLCGIAAGNPLPSSPAAGATPRPLLTRRELQVMQLIADGCRNSDIAGELGMSVGTVEFHCGNIFRKLGVRSRWEIVAAARGSRMNGPEHHPR